MAYELTITIKGGTVEVEAETPAQLERRVAALDLRRLEEVIQQARVGRQPAKRARRA
ncbi:MAG TPA: hypothetical protein VFH78_00990 [Candidatus Thermoplasmatota archaeon]|nr:hypothetical protein [Candidatus Thermoplasmatota archaeon]